MKINGEHIQSICYDSDGDFVSIIDQTLLPHEFIKISLNSLEDACHAIVSMQVRGAPLIGVTAAYGLYLALRDDPSALFTASEQLLTTRPTAVNLRWALQRMQEGLKTIEPQQVAERALAMARQLEQEDVRVCEGIGENGSDLIADIWRNKSGRTVLLDTQEEHSSPPNTQNEHPSQNRVNILTHCNAGALATVDWGTALAVIYKAADRGIPLHVWVDETRPRNQGAALTCWELGQQGIPHTLIVDNAGGHLMQQRLVDICLVGSDRTCLNGDVCNKIGTYLKALAAKDNGIPFYAALPVSSIDFSMTTGLGHIPIEERSPLEVSHISGMTESGEVTSVRLAPESVAVSNFGFDVTPARLVTGIITEKGVVAANHDAIAKLQD